MQRLRPAAVVAATQAVAVAPAVWQVVVAAAVALLAHDPSPAQRNAREKGNGEGDEKDRSTTLTHDAHEKIKLGSLLLVGHSLRLLCRG